MSGGHFGDCGYDYYKVAQFADELEVEIANNGKGKYEDRTYGQEWYPDHEPEVIEYLKEQLPKMRKMAEIMRIDANSKRTLEELAQGISTGALFGL
jgi:hypothetical protein